MRHLKSAQAEIIGPPQRPKVKRQRSKVLDDYREAVHELYLNGIPQRIIAAEFGCSRSTVARLVRELKK